MESLPLCKDTGEFGQRTGRTPDTTILANRPHHPDAPNYLEMADDSEFNSMTPNSTPNSEDSEFKATDWKSVVLGFLV